MSCYEIGAGGRIRTPDLLITNQLALPAELHQHNNQRTLCYHNKGDLSTKIYRRAVIFLHKGKEEGRV